MKNTYRFFLYIISAILILGCQPPEPKQKSLSVKHNYIILLDLSDRLIVQDNQPQRDKEIIKSIYGLFEQKVKKELYIKSRDEIKVVIAPQPGSRISAEQFEDELFINMETIKNIFRKAKEDERRTNFFQSLDALYKKALFSKNPKAYYGADIWKYFYEDLENDLSKDSLTQNYLFILTDGYPIVGKNREKLNPVNKKFPNMKVILLEGSPREKDLEWDRVMELWAEWFEPMEIKDYKFIKRRAISKVQEQIKDIIHGD